MLPHECIGKWKEADARDPGWIGAPGVKCATDVSAPPAKLVLSGDVKHQHECLGVYTLVAGREAYGWPVWKHVSQDSWIARVSTGYWMV